MYCRCSLRAFTTEAGTPPLVLSELDPSTGVATLTLNAPKKMNALSAAMGDQFVEAVAKLREEPPTRLRAVVLTGAGSAFSAGGDLDWLLERHNDKPSNNVRAPRRPIFAYAATTLR